MCDSLGGDLSAWPEAMVDALTRVLKGQPAAAAVAGDVRDQPQPAAWHVAAVLGTAPQLGLEERGVVADIYVFGGAQASRLR